ncbi:MAG: MFS transporter [Anaerolineaceae bacterium]|nr:MFS transporter [Anaerolineaceae bacterium]
MRLKPFKTLTYSIYRWFNIPQNAPEMDRVNFRNVQIDAIGVGLSSALAPFLPVLLTRLGADTFQVSMLTFMPAITGLILALPIGQFLQTRKNIVPWFSFARLAVLLSYGLTGLVVLLMPERLAVFGILGLWALVTIPQTILNVTFSVVMNQVAGSAGRYELMTHRWSVLGFSNAVTAFVAGKFLDVLPFPLNYQIVFMVLSLGGLLSFYFSSRINIPDNPPAEPSLAHSIREKLSDYFHLIWAEKPFISFIWKRFVFLTGAALAAPLLPIYYVRTLSASDYWIALINIAANTTVIIGYFFWMRQTRRRGSQLVLLATTFGASLFPIFVGISHQVWPVVIFAGLNGIFQAGLNLVFFDELMTRVPPAHSATFVAVAQSLQYLSMIAAPLLAPWLSAWIGYGPSLILAGGIGILGFILFFLEIFQKQKKKRIEAST